MVSLSFVATTFLATFSVAAENPIKIPGWGNVVNAGNKVQIQWLPTTRGNVNLVLREGGQQSLKNLLTIADNQPNTGSYVWDAPRDVKTNTDYSIEIQDVTDTSNSNYSPYFTILAVGEGITDTVKEPEPTTTNNKDMKSSSTVVESASNASSIISPSDKKNREKGVFNNRKTSKVKNNLVKAPVSTSTGGGNGDSSFSTKSSTKTSSGVSASSTATGSSSSSGTSAASSGASVENYPIYPHFIAICVGALTLHLL